MNKLNSKKTLLNHWSLIHSKTKIWLRNIYFDFYWKMKQISVPRGPKIELGSGGGFLKEVIPDVITSDVLSGKGIDKIIFAESIPYKNNEVSAFYMLNVFHHIKNAERAIQEMNRCLKMGGKIVMIEPWNSMWGRFIYSNLHHERFDPKLDWKILGLGRMSDANGALPWIIFRRDRQLFERLFPNLTIVSITPHTPFSYLISGGLSKSQLLPNFLYPLVTFFEQLISPLNNLLGMFATIELKKGKTNKYPNN